MFELLDFSPDAPRDAGLKPFAWGFVKMVSSNQAGEAHANALRNPPLRLQLYRWQHGLQTHR